MTSTAAETPTEEVTHDARALATGTESPDAMYFRYSTQRDGDERGALDYVSELAQKVGVRWVTE